MALQEPHGEEGGISGDTIEIVNTVFNFNELDLYLSQTKHLARKNGVWVSFVRDILNVGTYADEFCTLTLICFSTINSPRQSCLTINGVLFERFIPPFRNIVTEGFLLSATGSLVCGNVLKDLTSSWSMP